MTTQYSEILVGVSFDNRQTLINALTATSVLLLAPDNDNKFDKHAIKCTYNGEIIGYINKSRAFILRQLWNDNGDPVAVSSFVKYGGTTGKYFGVRVNFALGE